MEKENDKMLHTKTKPGTYDEHDYWVVSFTLIERATGKREHVEKTYRDVDYAYEDYLYYNNIIPLFKTFCNR